MAPVSSGCEAPSIITAQPPWQLPITTGFGACGCASATFSRKMPSARVMSRMVWPGSGSRKKMTKYTGWPRRSATPTWLSDLKPPMPAPCPARGSMMTKGRSFGSTGGQSSGTWMRTRA